MKWSPRPALISPFLGNAGLALTFVCLFADCVSDGLLAAFADFGVMLG